jgi:hypothetical protein
MQLKLLAQLGHGAVFAQGGQRHLRLEHCGVGAATAPRFRPDSKPRVSTYTAVQICGTTSSRG